MLAKRAWEHRTQAGQIVARGICLPLIALAMSLAACAPSGPQYTLTHDGGYRITLRAACPPTALGCDLGQRRATALPILSQRLADRTQVQGAVVRADGPSDIVVGLPRVTSQRDAVGDVAVLAGRGAVAILDTGDQPLAIGESTAGRTCTTACHTGQYPIIFTGEQLDRASIDVERDSFSGGLVVTFQFGSAYKQQFADYTGTHIGKYLTITADDVVIESAAIQDKIASDSPVQINGALTDTEAQLIADALWSGTLPIVLMIVGEERVSPSK
jgi:preprotein translocase subunit SecD